MDIVLYRTEGRTQRTDSTYDDACFFFLLFYTIRCPFDPFRYDDKENVYLVRYDEAKNVFTYKSNDIDIIHYSETQNNKM
jgi:hypothetical protein